MAAVSSLPHSVRAEHETHETLQSRRPHHDRVISDSVSDHGSKVTSSIANICILE